MDDPDRLLTFIDEQVIEPGLVEAALNRLVDLYVSAPGVLNEFQDRVESPAMHVTEACLPR